MCSWSMFVITAIDGQSIRNERSLSSASATMYSLSPSRALLPNALRRPPMTAVGSSPARSRVCAIIDVVVVFPCEPATAMAKRSRISSASISARAITGTPWPSASTISGLVRRTAEEMTTTSALPTFAAAWPSNTLMPNFSSSRVVTADRFASEPLTSNPRLASSSAMPLIPMPPMPTKWTRRVVPRLKRSTFPVPGSRFGFAVPVGCSNGHAGRRTRNTNLEPGTRNPEQRPSPPSRQPQDVVHDQPRSIRLRHPPRVPAHAAAARLVVGERHDFIRQPLTAQLALLDHLGGPVRHQRLCVASLVVVGGRRQRNQDRRPSRGHQLGERGGAGAADDQVGGLHLPIHREQERLDAGLEPGAPVAVADHRQIALSCLMRDRQSWCGGCQPRRRLHHGHVDRVRPLRAAKD